MEGEKQLWQTGKASVPRRNDRRETQNKTKSTGVKIISSIATDH